MSHQVLYQINMLLLEKKMVTPNERILIAVSGGQDSICVLNILYQLKSCWNWKLGIVYCDHKWQQNSKIQGLHISKLATNMNINFYQVVSTQTIPNETLARNWRYTSITRIAICHNYNIVVTGHSATDRMETLIYNLVRGSGTIGLQSLSWKRELNSNSEITMFNKNQAIISNPHIYLNKNSIRTCSRRKTYIFCSEDLRGMTTKSRNRNQCAPPHLLLIRPLLNLTRAELQAYVRTWHLPTWRDPTNQDFQIPRNRIRHQLLPYLRHFFNPNVDRILANWTEMVHAETMYFEALVNSIRPKIGIKMSILSKIKSYTPVKNYNTVNVKILQSLPIAIQRRLLRQCLNIQFKKIFNFEYLEQIRISYSLIKNRIPTQMKHTINKYDF